jgi:hypothetical protein
VLWAGGAATAPGGVLADGLAPPEPWEATGVTLGYWYVWEAGCMATVLYALATAELRSPRVKPCCSSLSAGFLAPLDDQLLVALSMQLMIADEVPVEPSA